MKILTKFIRRSTLAIDARLWVLLVLMILMGGCGKSRLRVTECHFETIAVLNSESLNRLGDAPCLFIRTEPDASTLALDEIELVLGTGEKYSVNKTLLKGEKPGLFLRKGRAYLVFVIKAVPPDADHPRIRLKQSGIEAPLPDKMEKGIPKDD